MSITFRLTFSVIGTACLVFALMLIPAGPLSATTAIACAAATTGCNGYFCTGTDLGKDCAGPNDKTKKCECT